MSYHVVVQPPAESKTATRRSIWLFGSAGVDRLIAMALPGRRPVEWSIISPPARVPPTRPEPTPGVDVSNDHLAESLRIKIEESPSNDSGQTIPEPRRIIEVISPARMAQSDQKRSAILDVYDPHLETAAQAPERNHCRPLAAVGEHSRRPRSN